MYVKCISSRNNDYRFIVDREALELAVSKGVKFSFQIRGDRYLKTSNIDSTPSNMTVRYETEWLDTLEDVDNSLKIYGYYPKFTYIQTKIIILKLFNYIDVLGLNFESWYTYEIALGKDKLYFLKNNLEFNSTYNYEIWNPVRLLWITDNSKDWQDFLKTETKSLVKEYCNFNKAYEMYLEYQNRLETMKELVG